MVLVSMVSRRFKVAKALRLVRKRKGGFRGFLERRDAGFFAQQSEHCQSDPRYFSPRQYNHAYDVDAGNADRFLARPGDVPVHRLKAWLNAPISE